MLTGLLHDDLDVVFAFDESMAQRRICSDASSSAEQFCQTVFDCVCTVPRYFLQRVCL